MHIDEIIPRIDDGDLLSETALQEGTDAASLLRGRIPCVVDEVTTLITPGSTVDVVVTEYGIAVNPRRPELAERLRAAGLRIVDIHDLRDRARKAIGTPEPLPFGDKVVGVVMNREGSVQDVIMNIVD